MLDLVAGLEWVRDNAEAFGGDPNNVMIFGESGGGAKVCTLLAMPAARGLFHRAAVQSGAWLRGIEREDANRTAMALLNELGITPQRIEDLQKVPVEKLLGAHTGAMQPLPPRRGELRTVYSPVVDGTILPHHPFDPGAPPLAAHIPVLVGCTEYEATLFYLRDEAAFSLDEAGLRARVVDMVGDADADRLITVYSKARPGSSASDVFFRIATDRIFRRDTIRLAERKFAQGAAPAYLYYFAWKSPALSGRLRAPHTVEIPFVFDNTDIPRVMTRSSQAKSLAAKVSAAWIAFARSGNPNHSGLPAWHPYDTQRRSTLVFDNQCALISDPAGAERKVGDSV
jgi:para-nitrobenzyl esterase